MYEVTQVLKPRLKYRNSGKHHFGALILLLTNSFIVHSFPERVEWLQEDPEVIAEVLFAVTSMLSFTRLAYILPAQESLGTLQISMGKMIDDMIRYKISIKNT